MAPPHKLDLYRRAVQHPEAEVRFLLETYAQHRGAYPTILREDFAGTAAVAMAWVDFADHHRAVVVESHGPTLRRAIRFAGDRPIRFVHDDVMHVRGPRADVIAALNFSVFEWHDRAALLAYLRHARRCLRDDGMLVVDLFGGPGAMRPGTQTRRIPRDEGGIDFDYLWEQRSFDHVTSRIDCRIHFRVGRQYRRNAFRYNWRLWSPAELLDTMCDAGFADARLWCDHPRHPGQFRPLQSLPARDDFVAYVVACR
jgi:SAM-dependent methyltransferase